MPVTITLQELAEKWLNESLGAFSQDTMDHYRDLIENHAYTYFCDKVEISEMDIRAFLDAKKQQGLSDSTVKKLFLVLRRVLEYGASMNLCPQPEWNIQLATAQNKHETVILTDEEERRLIHYLTENPDGKNLGLFLAITLGLNRGEILNLKWKDVSLKQNVIRVVTEKGPVLGKRRKKRDIAFGEREKIYLRKQASEPEFYVTSGSRRKNNEQILRARLKKAANETLLPPVILNDLRRTFVVHALVYGMPLDQVAKQIGVKYDRFFRATYFPLLLPATRARLEKEVLEARKVREAPEHIYKPEADAESTEYRKKIAARRQELKEELESLEGDLAIIRKLRVSDGVQGASRNALYSFIEKVLGDDKDAQFLTEYLRYNMRVEDMPLRKVTTSQAIHRHVTKGFEKLNARLDQIYAVEGYDILDMFRQLCAKIDAVAPKAPTKRGPKPKPSLESDFKRAMQALERMEGK